MDKFKACGLKTFKASRVKAPLIAGAVANFECKLVRITKPGNCPIVFGRVIAAHVHSSPAVKRLYTVGKGYRMAGVRPISAAAKQG